MEINRFFAHIRGKRVAFCGLGGSNLPLVKRFAKEGAIVTARDRRSREKLGQTAGQLEALGVRLCLGEGYLDDLDEDVLFRTPGMSFANPALQQARQRGSLVTSETELFLECCPCPVLGVTGSDGKTTTTTVLAKILEHAGRRVFVGGNIGKPLLPLLEQLRPEDCVVAELSSFQLMSFRQSPRVAVVTNISPNHLDWHKDMQEYVDAKKNIFLHQSGLSRTVLNLDNEITAGFAPLVRGQALLFSRRQRVENGCWLDGHTMMFSLRGADTAIMDVRDIKVPGWHNVENYMAAACAAWGLAGAADVQAVAKEFPGVPHRAELVRESGGVRWYNDSIATTPSRTVRGMLGLFDQPILLIAGGYDKQIPFAPLAQPVCAHVKVLVLLGATAPKIEAAVKAAPNYRAGAPLILHADSLEQAVALCQAHAASGDIVALSPACASFDMFPNYETRGDRFRELVQKL